ncbi:MAG: histidine--tRNA ligase [Planctomycetota bacterium]|nr:histidine--tRNA ligase [Planctomycetota bacterium]
MSDVNPPTGMRDVLPEDYFLRDSLIAVIRRVYESYGYVPVDTPVAERLEYLTGKAGGEAEQLMFKILKRGARLERDTEGELADMALRYDLTVSLCRFYATNRHLLPRLFRRYHVAPVWRADRPQRGRFREFYQCDVDVIGEKGTLPECEVILATVEAIRALGLGDHFVKISDRRLLPIVFTSMGFSDQEVRKAMVSVDKLDKIGVQGVLTESEGYLAEDKRASLERFLSDITGREDLELSVGALGEWGQRCSGELEPLLQNLRTISRVIREAQGEPVALTFWPSLVRGMAYYDGPIFEIWNREHPFSLAGGGRYDGLIGVFLGEEVPACGFSIGFERILTVMKERGTAAVRRTKVHALVALREEGIEGVGLCLARQLRAAGVATEVYPYTPKIKRQFEHAERLGIPWVVLVGKPEGAGQELELANTIDRSRAKASWESILSSLRPTVGIK